MSRGPWSADSRRTVRLRNWLRGAIKDPVCMVCFHLLPDRGQPRHECAKAEADDMARLSRIRERKRKRALSSIDPDGGLNVEHHPTDLAHSPRRSAARPSPFARRAHDA